jgi:hypothetical protein
MKKRSDVEFTNPLRRIGISIKRFSEANEYQGSVYTIYMHTAHSKEQLLFT